MLFKKFKDYIKSINKPEKEPTDPRTLTLEAINLNFQVLADSASDIIFYNNANYALYNDDVRRNYNGSMSYPCVSVEYNFMKDELDNFEKCCVWADKASDIFEKETEFKVMVEVKNIKVPIIRNADIPYDPDYANNDYNIDFEETGKSIVIIIINKLISNSLGEN